MGDSASCVRHVLFIALINCDFCAAAILGFHSMMNQDQYHASLLNKGQPLGLGWDGITKASQPKVFPPEPPNDTNIELSIQMVKEDNYDLKHLNWNNIKVSIFFLLPFKVT